MHQKPMVHLPPSAEITRKAPTNVPITANARALQMKAGAPPHKLPGATVQPPAPHRPVQRAHTQVLQRASTHVDDNGDFVASRGAALGDYGYRQLRMRTVSTALRNGMHYSGGGGRRSVDIFKITLLHGWNTTDTKTALRIGNLRKSGVPASSNTAGTPLTATQIDTIMPSTEEIQIVERANSPGNYVTLQGVGRLVAIRQWLQESGVTSNFYVQVMCYPASRTGANQLMDISTTYDAQESFLSRNVIGPAIYAGSALAAVGIAAVGAWAAFRRWRG
jgi:hypothetical protein